MVQAMFARCGKGQLLIVLIVATLIRCSPERSLREVATRDTGRHSDAGAVVLPSFSGDSAYFWIQQQLRFGPRVPGTEGHRQCRDFLVQQLRRWADTVWIQRFTWELYGTTYELSNIIARFQPHHPKRIWLTAHWDTRPFADEDPNPANRTKPIPGANDGGSGVAVLLELARIFAHHPPAVGIDIVLFDAEDMGKSSDLERFCIGSQYFAGTLPIGRPVYSINLDMVGDHTARFLLEENSMKAAPELMHQLWQIGSSLAPQHFVFESGPPVFDDHVRLIAAGIPAVNIIDQLLIGHQDPDPRRHYWHTLNDTIENISPATLKVVGQTVLQWVYHIQ